MKVLVCLDFDI